MLQYLLLRDNKQSGPYSLEDLKVKGLKGYDLIWIEGRSAAWRYPSEIEELKSFAPVIEEQPYDRFYKKANTGQKQEEKNSKSPSEEKLISTQKNISVERKEIERKDKENQPSKIMVDSSRTPGKVVVILPAQQNKDKQPERIVFHETVENKIAQHINVTEDTSRINQKTIRQPEEITILPTGKKSKAKLKYRTAGIICGMFVLVALGAFIGWSFSQTQNSNSSNSSKFLPTDITQTRTVQNQEPESNLQSNSEGMVTDQNMQSAEQQPAEDSVDFTLSAASNPIVTSKPIHQTKVSRQETRQVTPEPLLRVPEIKKDEPEKIPMETDDAAEKKAVKKNINELVKVVNNDYKVGPFGGINNIELKVTNNSPYPVDLVVVEVKYLLANKKEFKTENIYFKNLAAGTSMTKEAPKSPRGIKLVSKVALITSKALGMYQASL